jgi:hypothetical protein
VSLVESGSSTPVPTGASAATQTMTREPAPSREFMRVPRGSLLAPVAGWLTAWGAIVLAAGCLRAANVDFGLGIGIATGAPGVEDRFWPGLWVLVMQAAGFALGGYVAARMARTRAIAHALGAWALAMVATGADAIEGWVHDPPAGVLAGLDLPHWLDTGLSGDWEAGIALTAIALAALAGALVGGGVGAAANRAALVTPPGLAPEVPGGEPGTRTMEVPYPAAPPRR